MNLMVRPMTFQDIPQVVDIEKKSFPTPWSSFAFTCELLDNDFAWYLVLTTREDQAHILGYGGMWIIIDEAHITNIALEPSSRGRGWGRFLMEEMIKLAKEKGAQRMTLEVRVSNKQAQKLYKKLGFAEAGIRPGYYIDNCKDALIMWLEL